MCNGLSRAVGPLEPVSRSLRCRSRRRAGPCPFRRPGCVRLRNPAAGSLRRRHGSPRDGRRAPARYRSGPVLDEAEARVGLDRIGVETDVVLNHGRTIRFRSLRGRFRVGPAPERCSKWRTYNRRRGSRSLVQMGVADVVAAGTGRAVSRLSVKKSTNRYNNTGGKMV